MSGGELVHHIVLKVCAITFLQGTPVDIFLPDNVIDWVVYFVRTAAEVETTSMKDERVGNNNCSVGH